VTDTEEKILPLPIAGLMSGEDGYEVARRYEALDKMAKGWAAALSHRS
jgi:adenine deaminase